MDTKKMLQILIDGQAAVKSELSRIKSDLLRIENKFDTRLDKIGGQLAFLEDDAPTVEEFENLDKRVTKIELRLKTY